MKLAKRVRNLKPSLTLAITAKAKKMRSEGVNIVGLAAGEPDFDTAQNIKDAAIEAINSGFTKYTPASGMPELKSAIVDKLKKDNGLEYNTSSISVSCGAKHSLYNIFQAVCQMGDEVIIPTPYWLSYPEMVRLSGAKAVFLKTKERDGFRMKIDELKKSLTKRTKAIIINSPSNPTGAIYDREQLEEIADIAISRKLLIVSDEIYEKLIYENGKHISIASLGEGVKRLTLVVNGVSKSYSMTGWRIGYIAGAEEIVRAINTIQSHSTSNPASISQKAALEAIRGDQSQVSVMLKEFETRRNYLMNRIRAIEGISAINPEGAFYIFCNITKIGLGSIQLANKLLDEAKVAVIPGKPFGSDKHIRLSFAIAQTEIEEGINRIEKWVKGRL